jgi:hypothetical protein
MAKMPLAEHDNVAKTFLPDRTALVAATRNCFDRPSSNRGNQAHNSRPSGPDIAAPVTAESATQTAGAVTVTATAVTWSITEAAAKVIAVKTIATTITGTAGKCAGGTPGTSEDKDNRKNSYDVPQH